MKRNSEYYLQKKNFINLAMKTLFNIKEDRKKLSSDTGSMFYWRKKNQQKSFVFRNICGIWSSMPDIVTPAGRLFRQPRYFRTRQLVSIGWNFQKKIRNFWQNPNKNGLPGVFRSFASRCTCGNEQLLGASIQGFFSELVIRSVMS